MWQLSKSGRIDRLVVFRAGGQGFDPIGELSFEGGATQRLGRFVYAKSYLVRDRKRPIDPIGLPLSRKSRPASPDEVHLAFHDVGPDGWGKGILTQAFPMRELGMAEFLALGGLNRTGDLAFGPTPDEPLTWVPDHAPLMTLPKDEDDVEALLEAAMAVDRGDQTPHHLHCLLRRSADVGGARPKARLRYRGVDCIAKFPAWGDRFDDPRVEAACLDVAEMAGLRVPQRELLNVGKRSVLLVQRFDRDPGGRALSYLSAGTLLEEPASGYGTRKTYVDIADVALRIGASGPGAEMFKRWLVNSHLHNTDDHLRNHALLFESGSWQLSPVFDVVPHPGRDRHVCAPSPKTSPAWAPRDAATVFPAFGLSRGEADAIDDQVVSAVRHLPRFLDARGVSQKDRSLLAEALSEATGLVAQTSVGPN